MFNKQLNSPWGLDNLQTMTEEAIEDRKQANNQINILFNKCFNSTEGKKVLKHLKKLTLERETWDPRETEKFGYYREGQNDMVRHIINRITQAQQIK